MDKLDYQILAELHRNGELSFTDIAKNLNSTPCKIRRHYTKMKKEGKIIQCVTTINLARLGYQGKVFLLVTLTNTSKKADAINYLKNIKNIIGLNTVSGPCDLIAIAPIFDLASIETLIAEAKKGPNIKKVEFYCISNVDFPMGHNFDEVLQQRCLDIANGL